MSIQTTFQRFLFERSYLSQQVRKQAAPPTVGLPLDWSALAPALDHLAQADVGSLERRVLKGGMLAGASVELLTAMLDDGAVTSEMLVVHYLLNIYKANPHVHAVLHVNASALADARACDEARLGLREGRTHGELPALHGIPVLIKGNIGTGAEREHAAMPTTAGAAALADAAADRDATLVTRLREAGAILLGKTNLTEWANFTSSAMANGFSALGGQTRHPDGAFDVGGSSSGSAVAVRADVDFAPLAIGTETTGSLTYPASMHGVVTLKPSHGLISRDRIIPIADELDTAGPMARSVRDLARLLGVLAGEDARDPATQGFTSDDYLRCCDADSLRGARIGLVRGMYYGMREGVERTGDAEVWARVRAGLLEAGADAFEIEFAPPAIDNRALMHAGFRLGVTAYLRETGASVTLEDILAFNRADPAARIPYGHNLLEDSAASTMDEREYRALAARHRALAQKTLDEAFDSNHCDALLTFANYLSVYHATSGCPALTLPAGTRTSGEPVGVTFVGRGREDARLIAYAYALETALQGMAR